MLAVDAGHPLMDITHRLEYDNLIPDAMSVFESLKGIEREIASTGEAEGRHFRFIFSSEDQRAGIPEMELATALTTGRSDNERWHVRKDGSRFYCSGEVTALASKGFQGFVKIARDLTDHIKLHEEQQQSIAASLSSIQQEDQFFAVMSHELKHPLNLIQLNAQVARRLPVARRDPTLQKAIGTIANAVASQARIIDDLMDVARVRNGKLELQCRTLDLVAVLNEIQQVALKAEPGC